MVVNTLDQIRPESGVKPECACVCQRQMATIQLYKKKKKEEEDLGKQQRATALYRLHNGENQVEKRQKRRRSKEGSEANQLWEDGQRKADRWERYERPRLEESLFKIINEFFIFYCAAAFIR